MAQQIRSFLRIGTQIGPAIHQANVVSTITDRKYGKYSQKEPRLSVQDHDFSPIALMRLARAMKPMELDGGEEAILQEDIVLQAYFVIKGRVEAYVHEEARGRRSSFGGGDADSPPLRQASFLGVWGPGSMWGLSNITLGGLSEVRVWRVVLDFFFGTGLGKHAGSGLPCTVCRQHSQSYETICWTGGAGGGSMQGKDHSTWEANFAFTPKGVWG